MLSIGTGSSSKDPNWITYLRPPTYDIFSSSIARSRQSGNMYIHSCGNTASGLSLIKFDKNGLSQWQKKIQYSYRGPNGGLVIDSSENIYMHHSFSYTGYTYLPALSKFDTNGNIVYSKGVYIDTSTVMVATDIILSSDNNYVYCVGQSVNDTFFIKYNFNGDIQVQKKIMNSSSVKNSRICTDAEGNIYVSSSTSSGITIVKFNSSHSLIWQRYVSGINAYDMKCDKDKNVYLACYTYESPQSNPNYPISMTAVLVKYNTDGALQWQKKIIQSNKVSNTGAGFSSLAISDDGTKIYCSLLASWSMSYPELSNGPFSQGAGGINDSAVARFDSSGSYDWSISYSSKPISTRANQAYKIEIDESDTLYIATTGYLAPTAYRYSPGIFKISPQISHNESTVSMPTSPVTPQVIYKGSNAPYTYTSSDSTFSESAGSITYSDAGYNTFTDSNPSSAISVGSDIQWKVNI
jgi:hypothetical protein